MSGMTRVFDANNAVDDTPGEVHYEGCALIGSDTLCGHTDRTEADWQTTSKRVTCGGCIAVRDYVMGKAWR